MERHLIPTHLLAPIILEWLDNYEVGEMELPGKGFGKLNRASISSFADGKTRYRVGKLDILSAIARLPHRTIYGILHEERSTCTLRTADRLICATVGPHAWYTTNLLNYYVDPQLGWDELYAKAA